MFSVDKYDIPYKWADYIIYTWPTLFARESLELSRLQVFSYLFFTLGNGYEWVRGVPINKSPTPYFAEKSPYVSINNQINVYLDGEIFNAPLSLRPEWRAALHWTIENLILMYGEEHSVSKNMEKIKRNIGL